MRKESVQSAPLFWPAVLALLLAGLFLTPLHNVDLWWHLDSGRWMLEHGQYLGHEVHSFSIPGAAWLNFAWLFQVIIAAMEWIGGFWGLLLLKAAAWWLILFLLFHDARMEDSPVAMLLAPLLFTEQIFPAMHLRPHLFEGVFLACVIWLVHRQRGPRDPFWYALLILAWANCHASAVVGAAALALHYMWGADFRPPELRTLLRRLPVGLLLCSLIFATPNGFGILHVLLGHAEDEYLHVYIREWFSPESMPPFMFVALLAIAVGVFARRNLLAPAELLLITLFLILGRTSQRFLYELGLLLIRPTAILIGSLLSYLACRHKSGGSDWKWVYGLLLAALLTISYGAAVPWSKLRSTDYPVMKQQFPHVAMAVLQPVLTGEAELRVWNHYGWGGYLEWRGGERLTVYIDGRTPTVFTEEMMLNEKLARTRPQLLRSLLTRWKVDAVVMRRESSFLPIPPADPDWTLVGFDSLSFVYLRSDLAQRYGLPAIRFDPYRTWPSIDAWQADQAAQSLRHLLAQDADNDLAWQRLGQLLGYGWRNEDEKTHAEALDALQRAIALNPEDGSARLVLSWLRKMAGQTRQQQAAPVLDLLNTSGYAGFMGFDVQVAALLLDTGYPRQAGKILSPDDWLHHQQLDANFNVWLLRQTAHAALGEKEKAEFDRRMAEKLALDAGPRAMERLRAAESNLSSSEPAH